MNNACSHSHTLIGQKFFRLFYLGQAVIGAGALIVAFFVEYVLKILPCTFCIYERYPYGALLILGILGFMRVKAFKCRLVSLGLILLSYLASWGLSFYHTLVERKILPVPDFCGGIKSASSFDDLKEMVLSTVVVPCDKVSFTFLDLSLTEWNLGFATIMILITAFLLWFAARRST